MKTAAERAAEAIDELSTYDLYQRLASDMGCDAAIHRVNQQVAAIVSREYQELEQAATKAMYALLSGDPADNGDLLPSGYLLPADKVHAALDALRSALSKVRGQQ